MDENVKIQSRLCRLAVAAVATALALVGCVGVTMAPRWTVRVGFPQTHDHTEMGKDTVSAPAAFCYNQNAEPGTLYFATVVPGSDGTLTCDTKGCNLDTILRVKLLSSDRNCNDDISSTVVQSEVVRSVRKGSQYRVTVCVKAGTTKPDSSNRIQLNLKLQ